MNRPTAPCLAAALFVAGTVLAPALIAQTDDPLSHRRHDAKRRAISDFGGTRETEQAVADGLAWLAAHQEPSGRWDRLGFARRCPSGDKCSQSAVAFESREADVGLSALAALAFLGAGHTHEDGPYAETLSRAFSYILAQQSPRGSFAEASGYQMYCDAICTLAIAECYALTHDDILHEPLQRGIAHLARDQQPEGGWDYTSARTHRNDSSITGWCVMAIKAAQAAGVETPLDARLRLIRHFDRATEPDGRVWYADRLERKAGSAGARHDDTGGVLVKRRYGPAMTATGLFARSALSLRLDNPLATRQFERLLAEPPDLDTFRDPRSDGLHGPYYWYYGTLALFHAGGPSWNEWNPALRQAILEYQVRPVSPKGKPRHSFGSWPAFGRGWGKWGRTGGRVYSTAINTLSLEIYYRYVPAWLSPRAIIGPHEIRALIDRAGPDEQHRIIRLAARFHPDIAEPILLDLLNLGRESIAFEAALELGRIGSPAGRDILIAAAQGDRPPDDMARITDALSRIAAAPPDTRLGAVTAVRPAERMLLFNTGDHRVYYGQCVRVVRDGETIGTAVINRRFSGQASAAARLLDGAAPCAVGDVILAE